MQHESHLDAKPSQEQGNRKDRKLFRTGEREVQREAVRSNPNTNHSRNERDGFAGYEHQTQLLFDSNGNAGTLCQYSRNEYRLGNPDRFHSRPRPAEWTPENRHQCQRHEQLIDSHHQNRLLSDHREYERRASSPNGRDTSHDTQSRSNRYGFQPYNRNQNGGSRTRGYRRT